jgi:hypothetical protein
MGIALINRVGSCPIRKGEQKDSKYSSTLYLLFYYTSEVFLLSFQRSSWYNLRLKWDAIFIYKFQTCPH